MRFNFFLFLGTKAWTTSSIQRRSFKGCGTKSCQSCEGANNHFPIHRCGYKSLYRHIEKKRYSKIPSNNSSVECGIKLQEGLVRRGCNEEGFLAPIEEIANSGNDLMIVIYKFRSLTKSPFRIRLYSKNERNVSKWVEIVKNKCTNQLSRSLKSCIWPEKCCIDRILIVVLDSCVNNISQSRDLNCIPWIVGITLAERMLKLYNGEWDQNVDPIFDTLRL